MTRCVVAAVNTASAGLPAHCHTTFRRPYRAAVGPVMGRIHLLPGTTFSNPRERKDYPSEDKAAMTLSEFEHWLAVEISERYHRDRHRGLGATPLSIWEHAISRWRHQATAGRP